jgi:signal transduction histidine kinase
MTGLTYLDWALLSISLFNALLLLWLGLTVFLNADRRGWGIWLSSTGLLLGSIFFTSHSAILVQGINVITPGLNFWWYMGWISVVGLPLIWYVAVLWYSGYWDNPDGSSPNRNKLNQRQYNWFALTILSGLFLGGLLIFSDLLPSLSDLVAGRIKILPTIASIATLVFFYLLCISLSIDALLHAEKSKRLMGELARARARRWLMATSVLLLGVSMLAGGIMAWIVWEGFFYTQQITTFGWIDLGITIMIGASILLLGQAIASYEVFTGKTLPRRGLSKYWRRAVILSAGFSLLISGSIVVGIRPVYTMLLSVLVMITFLALLGWRSFSERERLINSLRPFAMSQNYVGTLLRESTTSIGHRQESQFIAPFQELCRNVLEAERAGLFPHGQMALLAGEPTFFPKESTFYPEDLAGFAGRLLKGDLLGFSLKPGEVEGAVFAIPLWREEGLCGMIFLGQKRGGRPYTQEEIEIAQATGEKLIDARASSEIIRRLSSLQRQHMAAGQVNDQRVRRELHDEILPQVHTAILDLASGDEAWGENGKTLELLNDIHKRISNLMQSIPKATVPVIGKTGLVGAIRQIIRDDMKGVFDSVLWQVDEQFESLAKDLPLQVAEVVYSSVREGLRNAARHGRGESERTRLCLKLLMGVQEDCLLRIIVEDSGVGIDSQHSPGKNGRGESNGQGLMLYSTLMAIIGGSLNVRSRPGEFTRVILELPLEAFGT